MQEILPPSRGRVRPVSRITPDRAPAVISRHSQRPPNVAVASPCQPYPVSAPETTQLHVKPLHERLLPKSTHLLQRISHRLVVALGRTTHKLHLVERLNARQQQARPVSAAAPQPRQKVSSLRVGGKRPLFVGLVVAVIMLITGYVSYDTWRTNNLAKEAFVQTSPVDDISVLTTDDRQSAEGKDESPLPANVLNKYRVAPNLPRALYIDKLNIAARILPMGINTDGSMQAPLGIYDAGWYSGSVRPGETGAMVLNGHSSGPTRQGLFGRLDTLQVGDEISLEKGDMVKLKYKVMLIETVPLAEVDMHKVSLPHGTAASGLNIYTCTGKWLPEKNTFDHRVIVYTAQVK